MTDRQRRRLASFQRIRTHFSDHPDAWTPEAPAVEILEEWDRLLAEIDDQREIQARDTTGTTQTKEKQVDAVIAQTMTVAKRLRTYARLRDDPALLPTVDVSASALERMNDVEMVTRVRTITDAGRARPAEALAPFKVTPGLLDTLDAEAEAVLPKEDAQDAAEDAQAVATARLAELFGQFAPLRSMLDDVVDSAIDDEAFRAGYVQARKVTD